MNDTNQTPGSSQETPPTPPGDWREQRRAERWARRDSRRERRGGRPYGWFGGAVILLIGIILLMQNFGYLFMFNWWALFILIPAFSLFIGAWEIYQRNGRLTRGAIITLTWGCLIALVAFFLLFNLNLGLYWPVLLIVGGLVLLGSALL